MRVLRVERVQGFCLLVPPNIIQGYEHPLASYRSPERCQSCILLVCAILGQAELLAPSKLPEELTLQVENVRRLAASNPTDPVKETA